jgi:hypothetical protein
MRRMQEDPALWLRWASWFYTGGLVGKSEEVSLMIEGGSCAVRAALALGLESYLCRDEAAAVKFGRGLSKLFRGVRPSVRVWTRVEHLMRAGSARTAKTFETSLRVLGGVPRRTRWVLQVERSAMWLLLGNKHGILPWLPSHITRRIVWYLGAF